MRPPLLVLVLSEAVLVIVIESLGGVWAVAGRSWDRSGQARRGRVGGVESLLFLEAVLGAPLRVGRQRPQCPIHRFGIGESGLEVWGEHDRAVVQREAMLLHAPVTPVTPDEMPAPVGTIVLASDPVLLTRGCVSLAYGSRRLYPRAGLGTPRWDSHASTSRSARFRLGDHAPSTIARRACPSPQRPTSRAPTPLPGCPLL